MGTVFGSKTTEHTEPSPVLLPKTVAYGYGKDSKNGWENLLVSVDENGNRTTDANEKISYDKIGNPVEYLNHDMSWFGRQLETINVGANTTDTADNKTISFKYGADGLRRTKTVTTNGSTVTSEFVYANDLLIYEKRGNKELYFYYDGLGHLTAVRYYSSASSTSYKQYYVATNLAGDVLAFVDGDGDVVAEYEYDAWGNCTIIDDDTSVDIATLNPIRYRGYYLDSETGFYYLQSRYYDPAIGRFISADAIDVLILSPFELINKNLFAYCDNNPIVRLDITGFVWDTVFDVFFIYLDLCALCNNDGWKNIDNWTALVIDCLFTAVPFATGGGQIIKLYNAADSIKDMSKITVVGETMSRLHNIAQKYNAVDNLYGGFKAYNRLCDFGKGGKVLAEIGGKLDNAFWLFGKLETGYTIIDAGIDVTRKKRSTSYVMEQIIMASWKNRTIAKFLSHLDY